MSKHRIPAGRSALITGGARSGKSRLAEELAAGAGEVVYLATAEALDQEMAERIKRHRRRRSGGWRTIEEAIDVPAVLRRELPGADALILDCVTLWVANLMGRDLSDAEIEIRAEDLRAAMKSPPGRLIVVTNEVGSGVVPANAAARRFRDLQGYINQRLAKAADHVFWTVSGIPLEIKGVGGD